jgi:DNA-binding CsgD family transcriptional regulator
MQSYEEIWKDIPNYEGYYQVSNLGRVKSFKWGKERVLKFGLNRGGYYFVNLWKGGEAKTNSVHRLVMLAFFGESELYVNHINGVKTDNRLENLEYCSRSENTQHAYDTGLMDRGENHPNSKLTRACAERIKYGHQGMTQRAIAEIYDITRELVSQIRSGKYWKHI